MSEILSDARTAKGMQTMSTDTPAHIHDSSPSNLTVESLPFDAVLRLGRKLVEELGLDESSDTLGRWMAHYVAELIQGVESAQGEERVVMQSRCADAILNLWKHRFALPEGRRPFERIESIVQWLESLCGKERRPIYFEQARDTATKGQQRAESEQWLELAGRIDATARILIAHCLSRNAGEESVTSLEWARLAEEIGEHDEVNVRLVRFLAKEHGLMNDVNLGEIDRQELVERLEVLDFFVETAEMLSIDLRSQLEKLGTSATKTDAPHGDDEQGMGS